MNPKGEKAQKLIQKTETDQDEGVGAMHKRRATMPDGKRYIIYYTFGEDSAQAKNDLPKSSAEVKGGKGENV